MEKENQAKQGFKIKERNRVHGDHCYVANKQGLKNKEVKEG